MNAWGCYYGTGLGGAPCPFSLGRDFITERPRPYLARFCFLAVISTVLPFAAYMALPRGARGGNGGGRG